MKILSLNTFLRENEFLSPDTASNDSSNLAIYCMDLNKNENLLAVGTIDGCIKIYDMNYNKLVSTLDSHSGTVTCIKWSSCGKFLISGSDDKCIIIWQKQHLNSNSNIQKMIHFQLIKRLIGHESDVQNISLNNTNNLLMSCGLDCKIIIWQFNRTSLQFYKLIELNNIHINFIKSCEFDPTGKFFATISDDKVLKIYKYSFNNINNTFKFNLEVEISEPFTESKSFKVTYFSKMHWSPNGQFLIIPNGKSGILDNCCILIDRLNHWDYSFKLIGNALPIEVCKFNPIIFVKENEYMNSSDSLNNITEQNLIIATGGQEKCLVIWSTTKCVPLIVLKNMFTKQISDLTWDKKGCRLYISSFDGDIKILDFEDTNELTDFINLTNDSEDDVKMKAIDPEQNYKFLQKYKNNKGNKTEGEGSKILETVEDIELEQKVKDLLPKKYQLNKDVDDENVFNKGETLNNNNNIKEAQPVVNILVAKRRTNDRNADGTIKKRRVALQTQPAVASPTKIPTPTPTDESNKKNTVDNKNKEISFNVKNLSKPSIKLPRLGYQTLIQGLKETNNNEEEKQQLFTNNNNTPIEMISSKIGLNTTSISTVLPDTDLHTEICKTTNHVFEIRNSKERKLIYSDPHDIDESYSNLTKMTCFEKGVIKWEYVCKENITQLLVLNDKRLCLCLDDHQLIFLSIKTGLNITSKLFFNDRILQMKCLQNRKGLMETDDDIIYLLLLSENGCITLMTEDRVFLKEIPTSHILYSDLILTGDQNINKIHCYKKIYDIYLDNENRLTLDLLVFEKLYQNDFEKYMQSSKNNHSHNKARYFKFDERNIFKQLRKQHYSFNKNENELLIKESYNYSTNMECWLLSD